MKTRSEDIKIVRIQPVILCKFYHFHQGNTDVSLLSFVAAHFLFLIRSPFLIAFRALLTCFVCH
jgi:hypothetical protein